MDNPSDLKAAYRLFQSGAVSHAAVMAPHQKLVGEAMKSPGEYLLIEDTTSLDFSFHQATRGLGRIGDDGGRGLFVHTSLAFRLAGDQTEMLGVYAQQVWARGDDFRCKDRPKSERLGRARESQRWARELSAPTPGSRVWYVADREGDIYECLTRCRQTGHSFVIRACQSRALVDDQRLLFEAVQATPCLGQTSVELRARPGQKARVAQLELRAVRRSIRPPWRPQTRGEPLELTAVEAREPGGELLWILLTDEDVKNFDQALRILKIYRCRWLIEEYHKALKTGCGIEESQLESAAGIEALLGVMAVVSARLLGLKLMARCHPDEEVPKDFLGPYGLRVLAGKARKKQKWTWRTVMVEVAKLGGFLARKGDGDPGWQTIWRGFNRLWERIEGAEALFEN